VGAGPAEDDEDDEDDEAAGGLVDEAGCVGSAVGGLVGAAGCVACAVGGLVGAVGCVAAAGAVGGGGTGVAEACVVGNAVGSGDGRPLDGTGDGVAVGRTGVLDAADVAVAAVVTATVADCVGRLAPMSFLPLADMGRAAPALKSSSRLMPAPAALPRENRWAVRFQLM